MHAAISLALMGAILIACFGSFLAMPFARNGAVIGMPTVSEDFMPEDITPLTLHFPDAETAERYRRWWDLTGKESCRIFMQGTLARNEPSPFLQIRIEGHKWVFLWDNIPF